MSYPSPSMKKIRTEWKKFLVFILIIRSLHEQIRTASIKKRLLHATSRFLTQKLNSTQQDRCFWGGSLEGVIVKAVSRFKFRSGLTLTRNAVNTESKQKAQTFRPWTVQHEVTQVKSGVVNRYEDTFYMIQMNPVWLCSRSRNRKNTFFAFCLISYLLSIKKEMQRGT